MNLRKTAFQLQDFVKGNTVTSHLNQIFEFYKNRASSSDALTNLIKHAKANVEFYSKITSTNVSDFPIVDKIVIKSSINKFRAQNYLDKKVVSMTTSGSTGTPFTVYQDFNKKARNHADTIYFGNLGGYGIGNKLWYLKIWVREKMSKPYFYKLQNIKPIDVITLSNVQIRDIITEIQKGNGSKYNFLGYVSALEQIIRYCEINNIKQIKGNSAGIITMSEGLSAETRLKLEKLFTCSVVSRYSNLENGIIAQQLFGEDAFLVNTASYYLEILSRESNEVLEEGGLGRIVVTDLYNYAMPMIRYDTGDLGSIVSKDGKTYIERIEGRKLDVLFDTSGEIVSSYIMYKNMWQYSEIVQYQLIQTHQKSYLFKINCETQFTKESQLIGEFKKYLGEDADFKVEYVNEIPLLESGKRRKTVNLYKTSIN
ncbi:phenylacetate-CoA ligase [Flavobacterium sp. PL11]|jgi:phenylacetate-CoA ligase|uniref:CoF synthetase n=1 Tax=Flavobacterium sp. PL11 TaxID=3071717 RepID=UPI002E004A4D|nr:phenylacetate-CoA ligase [Flavobacterium sp. PL11]